MKIAKSSIKKIASPVQIELPAPSSFELPEKVLQFGTGVLLRGLPDYFIDKANKNNVFNGRIVMVKSTRQGNIDGLIGQDNLYTLCIRGLADEKIIEEYHLNNAVSRILTADEQWDEVLRCASNEELKIVISNTTEVGIQLTEDDVFATPPKSFPGKLLSFLMARYRAFGGDRAKGMVVIPTELIVDNGRKLRDIVLQLAQMNSLDAGFIQWLKEANSFCNSLVDRIVPGKPEEEEQKKIEAQLGYGDDYLIQAEPYRLWAIETPSGQVNELLSFSQTDEGVILTDDISKYRELKLRLLNATHTFTCALAYLSGFETVKSVMEDSDMADFVGALMEEICFTIVGEDISLEEARSFARSVRDRFKNPFIVHRWYNISLQYSSKMKTRCVPLLSAYHHKAGRISDAMSRGLAAYMLFMRSEKNNDGSFTGRQNHNLYKIQDDQAAVLNKWWSMFPDDPVAPILSDTALWGHDLTLIPGLAEKCRKDLQDLLKKMEADQP